MAGLLKTDEQPAIRSLASEEFEIKALYHGGVHLLNPVGTLHMQMLVKKTFADQCIFNSSGRELGGRVIETKLLNPARTERAPQGGFRLVKFDQAKRFRRRRRRGDDRCKSIDS